MTPGRKRAFDKTEALDTAMRVFWQNGFAGTSISDLTEALSINKPSLYAAFGNKEQLFEAALEHYISDYVKSVMERLTDPPDAPLRSRLRSYLLGLSELACGNSTPAGCFFVNSCCETGGDVFPANAAASVQQIGLAAEQTLVKLIKAEQTLGRLATSIEPKALANYLISVSYGLSVLARRGKHRGELESVIDLAIDAVTANADGA